MYHEVGSAQDLRMPAEGRQTTGESIFRSLRRAVLHPLADLLQANRQTVPDQGVATAPSQTPR
jgi:hypothetical protein